ncbi:hypothetical protein LINPERPRIM_LOCUS35602 [Linum perenne]
MEPTPRSLGRSTRRSFHRGAGKPGLAVGELRMLYSKINERTPCG